MLPLVLTALILTWHSIFALRRRGALDSLGITHIVSVLHYDFKDFADWEKYKQLSIGVDDVDDENLLGEFPKTNRFIGDALSEGGKVFVHWYVQTWRMVISIDINPVPWANPVRSQSFWRTSSLHDRSSTCSLRWTWCAQSDPSLSQTMDS